VKKVFILNDQELYGKGIADVFEVTAKRIGLPVVANLNFHTGKSDNARPT
jgi:branched-chain amino acid transport system substrate-binding protein